MTERVKVYQERRPQSAAVPLWAWLLPLLIVLALLLWYLSHRQHRAPAAGNVPAATAVVPQAEPLPVLATIRFDPNKTDLSNEAKVELDQAADVMRRDRNVHLRLEGYTDTTGTDVRNENLAAERAAKVADYLQRKGVDPAQLTGQGFAAANPVATNATPQGRADNRRVELFRTQ